jgi:hypothetical protein
MRFDRRRGTRASAQRAGVLRVCRRTPARCRDARPLTDARRRQLRGFVALAEAFGRVADRTPSTALSDTLLTRREQIDISTTLYALRSLVDLACHQTGETPRTLLEAEFVSAPSDDFWRAGLRGPA